MVSEAGVKLCVGKIKTLDRDCLRLQNLMNDDENELEYYLSSKDIYKDLKLCGYDYGKHFQKLKYLRTNDFNTIRGQIEWSGNWITIVDSLLQTSIIAQPYRKLRVPTMIKYLRCNPKTMSKAIKMNRSGLDSEPDHFKLGNCLQPKYLNDQLKEEYDMFISVLPFHIDTKLNVLISPGIEIEGLQFKPINTLKEKQRLKLESYKFVANQDISIMQVDETPSNKLVNEHLLHTLIDIVSENNVPQKEIKVIEINLNGDLMAEEIKNYLKYFVLYQIDVKLVVVVKSFKDIPDYFKDKSFNFIECPKSKSLEISHFFKTPTDLIIWNICYQFWPDDIKHELQDKHDLLIEKGFLLTIFKNEIIETPGKEYNYQEENIELFLEIASNIGFILIGMKRVSNGSRSFLLRKINKDSISHYNNIDNIISIRNDKVYNNKYNSKFHWFQKLKNKITENSNIEKKENIWVVTNNCTNSGIIGMINCLRQEPGGDMVKCIHNLDEVQSVSNIFEMKTEIISEILIKNLAINVIKDGKLGTFRHLSLPNNFDQILSNKYFLNMTEKKEISGLRWFDLSQSLVSKTLSNKLEEKISTQTEIDCDIYMSGLNFKDVMIAIGKHI